MPSIFLISGLAVVVSSEKKADLDVCVLVNCCSGC